MIRVAPVALLIFLAGCLGATTPKEPSGEQLPWTDASEPWIVLSDGCGFCGPSPQSVQSALVLYKSGEVMQFRYGVSPGVGVTTVHENFTGILEEVAAFATLFAEENNTITATNITTANLGDDKAKIHRVLETGLTFARDPGEPDFSNTADAAPRYFTSPEWDVQLFGSYEGTAWQDILDQLNLVNAWIQEFPEHE